MKIQVTQDDIDSGTPHEPEGCPIALAIQRVLGQDEVQVTDVGFVTIGLGDFELPASAVSFISYFDAGYDVEPFEFELDVVE